jgi:predicted nucleic acid-binding protein
MTVVVSADFVVAVVRAGHPRHHEAVDLVETLDEDLVTSPLVLAEIDDAVAASVGTRAQEMVWSDFDRGAYLVRWWADALKETLVIARHHHVSLATASLVAVAGRVNTSRVATFDEQFRRILTTPDGEPFVVLPDDR